jgi:hypothetical protein
MEGGLLREEAEGYVLSRPLPPLAIPSSLQASLMARLDRLAPIKEVAQIGAVLSALIQNENSQRALRSSRSLD